MEAVKTMASVFDQTLGHFMTGCVVGAFGPANVAAPKRGEGPDADSVSDRDLPDTSDRS